MSTSTLSLITLFSVVAAGPAALAAGPEAVTADAGPHGGSVVQNESHKFEVKIDPSGKSIEVFTLEPEKDREKHQGRNPNDMKITLFRDSGSGQTIDLKAVNPADPLPKYQGQLAPGAASFIGAQLSFSFNLKSVETLKFVPYIPTGGSKLGH